MSIHRRLHHPRLRDDSGLTVVEMAVAGFLGAIVITGASFLLISSLKTGAFTQGQSETINYVRNAVQRIEKEVRGADSITFAPLGACSAHTAGNCIVVGAQTPNGQFRTVRYTHTGSELRRAEFDSGTATWSTPQALIQRVQNTGIQPVFGCDTQVTLLRVTLDLFVEPTPASDPNFHIQTSIRPRNFPSVATCP